MFTIDPFNRDIYLNLFGLTFLLLAYFVSLISFLALDAKFFWKNSSFNSMLSSQDGGVLKAGENSEVTLLSVTTLNTQSQSRGGVLFASNGKVTIEDSDFESASSECGGIVYADSNAEITIMRTKMNGAYAGIKGGHIYIHSSTLVADSLELYDARARITGCSIYAALVTKIVLTNLLVNNIPCENSAIAISISGQGVNSTISVDNLTVIRAVSRLYLIYFNDLQVSVNNLFMNVSSATSGGTILHM